MIARSATASSARSARAAINTCGRTGVGELGAVLARAEALVTGDTGPMHMAVAVGTPVVGLFFGPASPFDTGPYGRPRRPPHRRAVRAVRSQRHLSRSLLSRRARARTRSRPWSRRGSRRTGAGSTPWRAASRRRGCTAPGSTPTGAFSRQPARHAAPAGARTRSATPIAPRSSTCSKACRCPSRCPAALDVAPFAALAQLAARRARASGDAREAGARQAAAHRRARASRPRARDPRSRAQGARRHPSRHQRAHADVHVRQGEPRRRRRRDAGGRDAWPSTAISPARRIA